MLSLFTILRSGPEKTGIKPGEVALTFDDGPNLEGNVTPNLLNVLHQHTVKAGFCIVGRQVRRHPDVVRRMHQSGHLLINHTEEHHHPVRQKLDALLADIKACDRSIGDALGVSNYRSRYFRIPFGIVTFAVRRATKRMGLTPVLLTHYGWDTRVGPHNYHDMIEALIENAKQNNGGMYVLHDGSLYPQTPAESDWSRSAENRSWVPNAVDRIISELKAAGLRFVIPENAPVREEKSPLKTAA